MKEISPFRKFLRMGAISCAVALVSGCSLTVILNVGGTVNSVPVDKSITGGSNAMTSATTAEESNPATTTIDIPLAKGALK